MSRIPSPKVEDLSDEARQIYERLPMNVILMMQGASPAVAAAFANYANSFYSGTKLSPRLREIAALRLGYILNAKYELFQHIPLAKAAGVTDAEIAIIEEGGDRLAELDPQGAAVAVFTDEILKTGTASDKALANVREFLEDRLVMDLTLAIGCYTMVSYFLNTTGVDLDDAGPLDEKFVTKPAAA